MTDANVKTPLDFVGTPFQPIDVGNFVLALLAAPLVVGLLGIILVIPPFAVIFGYLPYLILGTPVFWAVLKVAISPAQRILGLMVGAFAVNFLSGPLYAWYFDEPLGRQDYVTYMGMIFAPLWAGVMGLLYNRWAAKRAAQSDAVDDRCEPPFTDLGTAVTPEDISKGARP